MDKIYNIPPEEEESLRTLIDEHGFSQQEAEEFLQLSEGAKLLHHIDVQKDWKTIEQRIWSGRTIPFYKTVLFRAAAVITVLMAVSFIVHFIVRTNTITDYVTITNNALQVKHVTLPDESIVTLNQHASITYPQIFRKSRNISLTGEAFFDVKRNEHIPFMVDINTCRVKVLGTSFSITPASKDVTVIVTSGKVAFYIPADSAKMILLEKGEKGVYSETQQRFSKELNTDPNYLFWKDHILQFHNTRLDDVLHDLSKHFKTEIILEKASSELPFYTSRFEAPTLTEVLEEMKLVLPIEYTSSGNKVIVKLI